MTGIKHLNLRESLERFSHILSDTDIAEILSLQNNPLPTGIRINRLKCNPKDAIRQLAERYGWTVKPVSFNDNAWTIHTANFSPGVTIEHRMGQYYLQDIASMVPVSLFDIHDPNMLILDMAASPGGKTTHLVDRTLDKGFIIANDASKGRIAALKTVLSTWGAINMAVTNYPGEFFGAWYPETFDRVLLDAPCSMENLRPTDNHPLRETSRDERLRLQERQIQLLTSGLQALKTGGQLVYATCSLAPEEDEAVIDAVLKTFPGTFNIDQFADKFLFASPGLSHFEDLAFHPDLSHVLRLWPHLTGMSGFFCARITKTHPISKALEPPPSRDFDKTDLVHASEELLFQVCDQVSANYGLNLMDICEDHTLNLFRRYEHIFLIPERYLEHFMTLPYTYIGMPLGRWLDSTLEPSHEFISRFGHMFTRGFLSISDDHIDQWIAGRDIRNPDTDLTAKGQYLAIVDKNSRNLGMGKLLPKRLRNMLPRRSI